MSVKKILRFLIDNYEIFTRIQIWRYRNKYPATFLNMNYSIKNPTIHFLHRYITNNTGDKACGYYQYFNNEFENYRCIVHDVNCVHFSLIKNYDIVIVGGGGLLNATAEWNYCINKATRKAGKSIIWSAGFNSSIINKKSRIDFKIIDLVSVRDFSYATFNYVPCATCMMPELDEKYANKRIIGLVAHKDVLHHIPKEFQQYDNVANFSSVKEIIEFIGSSEIILTNSYHAIYWSQLMNKKCILFAPRSEKYNYFKYPPVIFSGDLQKDLLDCEIYSDALSESRALTLQFLKEIKYLIAN